MVFSLFFYWSYCKCNNHLYGKSYWTSQKCIGNVALPIYLLHSLSFYCCFVFLSHLWGLLESSLFCRSLEPKTSGITIKNRQRSRKTRAPRKNVYAACACSSCIENQIWDMLPPLYTVRHSSIGCITYVWERPVSRINNEHLSKNLTTKLSQICQRVLGIYLFWWVMARHGTRAVRSRAVPSPIKTKKIYLVRTFWKSCKLLTLGWLGSMPFMSLMPRPGPPYWKERKENRRVVESSEHHLPFSSAFSFYPGKFCVAKVRTTAERREKKDSALARAVKEEEGKRSTVVESGSHKTNVTMFTQSLKCSTKLKTKRELGKRSGSKFESIIYFPEYFLLQGRLRNLMREACRQT